jgi:hypothetical protein
VGLALSTVQVRHVRDEERPWVRATIRERWGDEIVVGRGRVWTPHELPAVVAVDESGERVGLATFVVGGSVAELVSIDALRARRESADGWSTPSPPRRGRPVPSACS